MAATQPIRGQKALDASANDASDINELFGRILVIARGVALVCLDIDDAEDAAQDVALDLWRAREANPELLSGDRPLERFVYVVTMNEVKRKLRAAYGARARTESIKPSDERPAFVISGGYLAASLDRAHARSIIDEALAAMPEGRAAVFCLIRDEGLSKEEVAERRGVSINTVKTQLRDAQRAVREALDKYREETQ